MRQFVLAMKEIPTGAMQRLYSYVENESNFHVLMGFNLRHKVDNLPYFNIAIDRMNFRKMS